MAGAVSAVCKDCLAEWVAEGLAPGTRVARKRPAPHPGPRCATHHRARRTQTRSDSHARRLATVYGITAEFYRLLLAFQGGACAICARATGKTRRLAVDHDHQQAIKDGHDEDKGCPQCVRGLLCGTCNKVLGHFRDDPQAFVRGWKYLQHWPAKRVPRSDS